MGKTKTSWKKGQSGNLKGRPPKGWSWAELLESVGEETEPKTGKKFKELVSRRIWVECVNGNITAIRELFNRMEGMPKQSTDITTGGERIHGMVLHSPQKNEK